MKRNYDTFPRGKLRFPIPCRAMYESFYGFDYECKVLRYRRESNAEELLFQLIRRNVHCHVEAFNKVENEFFHEKEKLFLIRICSIRTEEGTCCSS